MQNNFLTYSVVNGYPNYWIFSNGSCQNIKSGRVLVPRYNKRDNRYCYNLSNKGAVKTIMRARLVAMNLLPNPNNLRDVDHRDGDSTNDDITNLRWLSHIDNMHNLNETADAGVYFNKATGKWYAQIRVNNKKKHLGYFITKLEAQIARAKGKALFHKII